MDLIRAIASCIAYAEAGPDWWTKSDPSELPVRDHNPGDLRAVPADPTVKTVAGFAVAVDDQHGVADLIHQLALDIARGQTLPQLITSWAPASDGNNTANYIAETQRRLASVGFNIDPNKALLYQMEPLVEIP